MSIAYAPFISLFAAMMNLNDSDTDAARYAQVQAFVAAQAPDTAYEITPFLATMLGIVLQGDDLERVRYLQPPMLRERIFAAVRMLVEAMAARQPLALVFDDIHWIDATSLELLQRLLPLASHHPLLIVALFRPTRQDPSWQIHELAARDYAHRYTAIMLEPLDDSQTRALVSNLLHIEGLPESVRQLILNKAEGNPFFVEEVIRSLLDAKLVVRENGHWRATQAIADIAVPDTLAGVITARLDRLDETSKRTAQTAAVIVREFGFAVLSDVHEARTELDAALEMLQQRELVREKDMPHQIYMFKHVLTQETAYGSLLMSKRRDLHRRVAACLERTDPDRINEIAAEYQSKGIAFVGINRRATAPVELEPEMLNEGSGFTYVALGHLHSHDRPTRNACYSGSLERLTFGDRALRKGWVEVDLALAGQPGFLELHEVEPRPFLHPAPVDASGSADLLTLLEDAIADKSLEGAMVRIELVGVDQGVWRSFDRAAWARRTERALHVELTPDFVSSAPSAAASTLELEEFLRSHVPKGVDADQVILRAEDFMRQAAERLPDA